jgi:hypothetical protein
MVGLRIERGDVEHRQPAMTTLPQANLQNLPDTTAGGREPQVSGQASRTLRTDQHHFP